MNSVNKPVVSTKTRLEYLLKHNKSLFSDLIKTQEDAMRQKGEAARQMARAEEAEQASEQLRGKLKVNTPCDDGKGIPGRSHD